MLMADWKLLTTVRPTGESPHQILPLGQHLDGGCPCLTKSMVNSTAEAVNLNVEPGQWYETGHEWVWIGVVVVVVVLLLRLLLVRIPVFFPDASSMLSFKISSRNMSAGYNDTT